MKIIESLFTQNCPTCGSSNVKSEMIKHTENENEKEKSILDKFSQSNQRETFVCVDCDPWIIDNKNKSTSTPGAGGNWESGVEADDGNTRPSDTTEHPQKS